MDRDEFAKEMNAAKPKITKKMDKIINNSLTPLNSNDIGTQNLVIVIEEFLEAGQEVSKYLRGKVDITGLTEEMADAFLSIKYVQKICGISDEDLNRAINVKLKRQKKRNKSATHSEITHSPSLYKPK